MWTREELKSRAKAVLRVSYWKAFLISLVIAFIAGGESGSSIANNVKTRFNKKDYNSFIRYNGDGFNINLDFFPADVFPTWLPIAFGFVVVIILIIAAFRIFIGYLLEVGGRRYYIRSAQNDINMNNLGYGFNSKRYKNIVITMLWRAILNFLWFLLLIIPGIVKAYAYRMVPYILAENPNIDYDRAIELSMEMTDGEKFNMFVLDLSFLGWYLLGLLAFGMGEIFVNPYKDATDAELYLVLKQNAINRGLCTYNELIEENSTF